MKNLADIFVFMNVAKYGSFTKASIELDASKSYISRKILELENRLDAQLLTRTTRKVSLTEEGRAFYFRCVSIFDSVSEAEQAVIDLKEKPIGTLRMTVAGTFGEEFIVPVAVAFMSKYPDLSVEIDFSNRLVDIVSEGYDLAIRAAGSLKDSSLIARRVTDRELLICASPDYLQKYGNPYEPNDLLNHNCLVGSVGAWRFREAGKDLDFRVSGNWRSNNGKALTHAAREGVGITQLPSFYLKGDIENGRLVTVLNDYKPKDTAVWAVYPHNRHLSAKVSLFIKELVEHFSNLD